MKILKIIGHPIAVISSFLLIMISGEAFGGPYILYLLLGLFHGAGYAITAATGILLLSFSLLQYPKETKFIILLALVVVGTGLLVLSLSLFFEHDRLRYNNETFVQTVPLFTLFLFGACVVCAVIVRLMGEASAKSGVVSRQ